MATKRKDNFLPLLNKVKQVLDQDSPKEGKTMAKKATQKVEADEAEAPKTKAKAVKAAAEPKDSDDANLVKLADLVKEAKTTGQAARRKLRAKEFERSGRWAWPAGSADLKAVREALGLPN